MLRAIQQYQQSRGQKGAILVLAAAAMALFLGCSGLAVDIGNIYVHKARLQNAADAAVIAGGYKYGEQESQSDAKTQIQNYLNSNTNVSTLATNTIFTTKSTNSTKITLTVNETVPLYFLKLLSDKDAVTLEVKSAALCNKARTGTIGGIFDYTFLGGYSKVTPQTKSPNALLLDTDNLTISGKIHVNGAIYLDNNHTNTLAAGSTLTCNATNYTDKTPGELWANYRDNYWEHVQDTTGLHKNDEQLNNNWRYYYRLKDSAGNDAIPSATGKIIDISLKSNNAMTNGLYDYIQTIKNMSLKEREQKKVYYESDGDYSRDSGTVTSTKTYSLYDASETSATEYPDLTSGNFKTTDNAAYHHPFHTIIVDDNLNATIDRMPATEQDYVLLISLHGNIQLNLGKTTFRGFAYAPNGDVWINVNGSQKDVSGSFVGQTVRITSGTNFSTTHSALVPDASSSSGTSTSGSASVTLVDPDSD